LDKNLQQLLDAGQSVWLDSLSRRIISSGERHFGSEAVLSMSADWFKTKTSGFADIELPEYPPLVVARNILWTDLPFPPLRAVGTMRW
jgi:hypothetical protein